MNNTVLVASIIAMGAAFGLAPFAGTIRHPTIRVGVLVILAAVAVGGLAMLVVGGIVEAPRNRNY
jgi:hypothetical protein